jgi:rhamnogalacturonyl hydrolase YesR
MLNTIKTWLHNQFQDHGAEHRKLARINPMHLDIARLMLINSRYVEKIIENNERMLDIPGEAEDVMEGRG